MLAELLSAIRSLWCQVHPSPEAQYLYLDLVGTWSHSWDHSLPSVLKPVSLIQRRYCPLAAEHAVRPLIRKASNQCVCGESTSIIIQAARLAVLCSQINNDTSWQVHGSDGPHCLTCCFHLIPRLFQTPKQINTCSPMIQKCVWSVSKEYIQPHHEQLNIYQSSTDL